MSPDTHPSAENLLAFVERRVSAADGSPTGLHLAGCPACSRQAAAFERLLDLMRNDASVDAPEHVLNRAFRLLRTHRLADVEPEPAPQRRSFIALLLRDSFQSGFAMGVRGSAAPTRQLLFDIGDGNELELQVEPAEGGWRVAGQILGNCSGGQVRLEGVAGSLVAELNAQCEFSLPPQPGPLYKLVLLFDEVEIDVPILEFRG
jgi:hypothetical protein